MTDYNAFGSATTTGQGSGAGAGLLWQADSGAYTFGQRFRVDTSGLSATKVRFYVPAGSPNGAGAGYYVAVYDVGGSAPLQQAGPFTASVGWNEVSITPVALTLGADYMAAALFPGGHYSAQSPNATPWDPAGPLNLYADGSYNSGSSLTYPNSTSGTFPSYGIDVTVSDGASGIDGSGTAASGATTATGSGTLVDAGSGTAASGTTTASGTGTATTTGSGTAASGATTASGTGTLPLNGSGTASSGATTATGTGTGPVAAATVSATAARLALLWFTETASIERSTGRTGYASTFAAPADVLCAIDHGAKEVRTVTGEAKTSSARVFVAVDNADVPVGSRVTLPATHGGESAIVLERHIHRSGLGTPDHVELVLT